MYVKLDKTIEYIFEDKIDIDDTSMKKFSYNPKGVLIQDTYNNPFFPIKNDIRIDSDKIDLKKIYKLFNELYNNKNSIFLPWHYCIEFIEDRYYVFNTRPINIRFPYNNNKISTNNFNYDTQIFFDDNIFDISDAIHICIIGDTNTDTYTKDCYRLIGKICLSPLLQFFKLPGLFQRVFLLNIGKRFNITYLQKFSIL